MKTTYIKQWFLLGCILIMSLILSLSVDADFKGHHTPGGWGLQSGSQTPPGSFTLTPLYSRYHVDTLDRNLWQQLATEWEIMG